uniref:Uncharacterized protein n=1 Tax=Rhizophora mucronata TaxID=61149 RepID=A0A2P2Q4U6_RHIMU
MVRTTGIELSMYGLISIRFWLNQFWSDFNFNFSYGLVPNLSLVSKELSHTLWFFMEKCQVGRDSPIFSFEVGMTDQKL